MLRGGAFNNNNDDNLRCAVRNRNNPTNRNNNIGFRIVVAHDLLPELEMPRGPGCGAEAKKEDRREPFPAAPRVATPGAGQIGRARPLAPKYGLGRAGAMNCDRVETTGFAYLNFSHRIVNAFPPCRPEQPV